MTAESCVFCGIVAGDIEASTLYADDTVMAFMDLKPMTAGHLLVVPRRHAAGLDDLPDADGRQLWSVAHLLARAMRGSGLRCEGVNLFVADGKAAWQEVLHVHIHVIPRFRGDGMRIHADFPDRDRAQLDADAAAIRDAAATLEDATGTVT
jgi:histidine triad (HIT) family protein